MPVAAARAALASDRALLVDLSDAAHYALGHAPGAVPVQFDNFARLGQLAAGCDKLYLICRSGRRSMLAARELAAQGIHNVANVAGGMHAWKEAGLDVVAKEIHA